MHSALIVLLALVRVYCIPAVGSIATCTAASTVPSLTTKSRRDACKNFQLG